MNLHKLRDWQTFFYSSLKYRKPNNPLFKGKWLERNWRNPRGTKEVGSANTNTWRSGLEARNSQHNKVIRMPVNEVTLEHTVTHPAKDSEEMCWIYLY